MVGWGAAALAVTVVLLSRMGRIGSQGLFDDGRWSVYGFCVEAIRQRPLLEPDLAPLRICFLRCGPTVFTVGVCGTIAHSTILEIAVEMGNSGCGHGFVLLRWRRCLSSRALHFDQRAEVAARWLRSPGSRSSAISIR